MELDRGGGKSGRKGGEEKRLLLEGVEMRKKKTNLENLKPRSKLIKQQRQWRTSQKTARSDFPEASTEESTGDLKLLLLRRFK